MKFRFDREVGEDLAREFAFGYRDVNFDEEDGKIYCETPYDADTVRKIFARAVCTHKSDASGKLYVTAEEAEDSDMMLYLKGIYRKEHYLILPAEEAYAYTVTDEEFMPGESILLQVSGDISTLERELHIRFYETSLKETAEGTFLEIKNCGEDGLRDLLPRVTCMEETVDNGLFYVSWAEISSRKSRSIFKWKYHVNEFFTKGMEA